MQYTWSSFNLQEALAGKLVAIHEPDDTSASSPRFPHSGILRPDSTYASEAPYKVTLGDITAWCNSNGVIKICPEDENIIGQTLMMVSVTIPTITSQTRSRTGSEAGEVLVTSVTPLDHFATEILNAIIKKTDHPEQLDGATMLHYAQKSYQWAQAMMQAAADNRAADQTTPTYDVSSSTDKLLASIAEAIGDISGSGGTADITPLTEALGYDPDDEETPVTQATVLASIATAIQNAGKINKDDIVPIITPAYIDYLLAFYSQDNYKQPVKITPTVLSKLLKVNPAIIPVSSLGDTLLPAYYYHCTAALTNVTLWLPTLLPAPDTAQIIMVNFTTASTGTPTLTICPSASNDLTPVKYRNAIPQLENSTTYEVDIVHNGTYWIAGITKIVSS